MPAPRSIWSAPALAAEPGHSAASPAPGLIWSDGDAAASCASLASDGLRTVVTDGGPGPTARSEIAALAAALRMPHSAGKNPDALADGLRDLARWWPDDPAVAVVWTDGEALRAADPEAFAMLVEILSVGHQQAWAAPRVPGATGSPEDRLLWVVLPRSRAGGASSTGLEYRGARS